MAGKRSFDDILASLADAPYRPPPPASLLHYRIVGKLGEGGMGTVFEAEDTKLGRRVAIKRVTSADPGARARLRREARAVSNLVHPNIVTVFAIEEIESDDFIVMELVGGETLADLIERGPLDLERALAIVAEIAEALECAHAAGLVHRDIKPSNVMITADGRAKVLDFGIAKQSDESPVTATAPGTIVGTIPYMSPEQVDGSTVDRRSDIFSLGVLLYEMTTGRRPFVAPDAVSLIHRITTSDPPPPSSHAPKLPPELDAIIRRALAKKRTARFESAAEMGRALRALLLARRQLEPPRSAPAVLDERLLETKLEELESARAWSPRVVKKLETLLHATDAVELFRVDPLAFAAARNVAESEAVDLFLHATKLGLFTMEWQLICPQCCDTIDSLHSLGALAEAYYCDLCLLDLESSLDDFIKVSFTVSPAIRTIPYHDPESLSLEDYTRRYRFGEDITTRDGQKWVDAFAPFLAIRTFIEAGETFEVDVELHRGKISGAERTQRASIFLRVDGEPVDSQLLDLRLADGAFTPFGTVVRPGPTRIRVHNATAKRVVIQSVNIGPGHAPPPPVLPPRLTGKQLFVTPTFAELFPLETIRKQGTLALKDLTLLFAELRGAPPRSDVDAFRWLGQQIDLVGRVVAGHHGALVRTVGYGLMASFATPLEAVCAALDLREALADGTKLSIGIHRGSAIAVTLNERLDYFGETVAIAESTRARAAADEICFTKAVFDGAGVADFLATRGVDAGAPEGAVHTIGTRT